jgi:hypothetical protein
LQVLDLRDGTWRGVDDTAAAAWPCRRSAAAAVTVRERCNKKESTQCTDIPQHTGAHYPI